MWPGLRVEFGWGAVGLTCGELNDGPRPIGVGTVQAQGVLHDPGARGVCVLDAQGFERENTCAKHAARCVVLGCSGGDGLRVASGGGNVLHGFGSQALGSEDGCRGG